MTEYSWLREVLRTDDVTEIQKNFQLYVDSFVIDVTDIEAMFSTSSKGNQRKWYVSSGDFYVKEALYYKGKYWKDYLCEVIASEIYKQFNMPIPIPFIEYSVCYIKCGNSIVPGCLSKNFLTPMEELVTFGRLLGRQGIEFPVHSDFDSKWNLILDVMNSYMSYDIVDELVYMFVIDFLMGNEDRHINNFGLCRDIRTNKFYLIPMFDTGMSLLQGSDAGTPVMRPFGMNSVECMQNILRKRNITGMLPNSIDVSKCSFPSEQSLKMFVSNAHMLNIDVKVGDNYDIFRKFRRDTLS